MSNATIDQLTRINTVYVQTIREQDARIASLETQLAAAQERERIFRAEADYYLAYIYRGIFEDERERGEFEDDAIRIANNIMASLKQSALAAAQKGSAPASDGEQEGAGE